MSNDPCYVARIALRDGREALVRPLETTDVETLGDFFVGLSAKTRSTYGPHPFDRATATKLCGEVDDGITVRFVGEIATKDGPEFVGYMILTRTIWPDDIKRYEGRLDLTNCACLAPVIADAYQGQGVGTAMAQHVMASAHAMGLKQIILMGGVIGDNHRARKLYERLGFQYAGEFWTPKTGGGELLNYSMIVEFDVEPGA